jgi:hypothetical protein
VNTTPPAAAPSSAPAPEQPATGYRLTLNNGREVTVTETTHPHLGAVTYYVTGPRLLGAFTLSPDSYSGDPDPAAVRVELGDDSGPGSEAHTLPVVNGITATGSIAVDPDQLGALRGWSVFRKKRRYGYYGDELPKASRDYLIAVAHGLLARWAGRSDLPELRRAAARHRAPGRLMNAEHNIERLRDRIEPLAAELREYEQRAAALREILAERESPAARNDPGEHEAAPAPASTPSTGAA